MHLAGTLAGTWARSRWGRVQCFGCSCGNHGGDTGHGGVLWTAWFPQSGEDSSPCKREAFCSAALPLSMSEVTLCVTSAPRRCHGWCERSGPSIARSLTKINLLWLQHNEFQKWGKVTAKTRLKNLINYLVNRRTICIWLSVNFSTTLDKISHFCFVCFKDFHQHTFKTLHSI